MIRSRWGSSVVLISLVLVAMLVGMFDPVLAAGEPLPRPDVEGRFWSRYLVTEYGLSPSDLTPLLNAGMGWEEIRDYLERLYPHTQPLTLGTRQYVELAGQTGITPVEASKAYEFALRYRRDPAWFASLYRQTGSWDKITHALIRYSMAESRLFKEQSKHLKTTSVDVAQAIASVYGVSGYDVQQKIDQGIEPTVLLDLFFIADLHDKKTELARGKLPDSLKGDSKDHAVEGLHRYWSMRRFPSHLLPLRPPPGWEKPQVQTTAPLGQAYPVTLPGMPPFQLKSNGGSNQDPFATDSPRLQPESIATIQSTTEPSIYSPSALYDTGRVSPFKAYFEGYSETIDPSTGALIIRQTDFVLPGRNGLDFAFTRLYNSSRAYFDLPRIEMSFQGWWFHGGSSQRTDWDYYEDSYYWIDYYYEYVFTYGPQFSSDGYVIGTLTTNVTVVCYDVMSGARLWTYEDSHTDYDIWGSPSPTDGQPSYSVSGSLSADTYFDRLYGLGVGWALDLPSVELRDNTIYLHYQGSTYEITSGAGGYTLSHHPIEDLKFQTDTSYTGSTYSLRRKDGLTWYFRSDGRLLAVKNRFGDKMTFEYDSSNRMARIFDTVGRKIEFTYTTSQVSVSVYAKSSPGATDWGTALFTWIYVLTGTSHSGKQKLAEVVPPEPDIPHIFYTYEERRTQFTPWVENGGSGLPVDYDYLLLKEVKHPSTGASGYDYVAAFKDMTSDDPSSNTPAQLGYFRVGKRYDRLVSGQEVNRFLFEYWPWNGTTQRYGTTRQPASSNWYPVSSDLELWEYWEFDQQRKKRSADGVYVKS